MTLLLDREERPVLLALDEQGEAIVWQDHSQIRSWIRLGQRLIEAIVAVEGRDGCLDLFGVDREGVVRCHAFDPHRPEPGDWRKIGGNISGDLVAMPHQAGTALFAIDRESHIAHVRYRGGDAEPSWQRIGGPLAEWFSVVSLTEELGGLLISALTAERVLHVLHWHDFPAGQPDRLWQEKGPIDTMTPMQPIKTSLPSEPGTDEPHDTAVSAVS